MTRPSVGVLFLATGVASAGLAGPAEAQARRRSPERCRLALVRTDRQGLRVENVPGVVNLFLGGNVHLRCQGQKVDMFADSVAVFGENVAQFIGNVRYVDSTTEVKASFGQYTKVNADEYFDAQGNVHHTDRINGSTIVGPHVIYYRAIAGIRPEGMVFADRRPTVTYAVTDSAGRKQEPYLIVGDRVRLVGGDALSASGRVTVDRSDLRARSDTLWLDSGEAGAGLLASRTGAHLNGIGRDSFAIIGKAIDMRLANREIVGLKARDSAHAEAEDVTIDADSLQLDLTDKQVERVTAWGDTIRPRALSADYEIRGDSLVIETPGRQLQAVRAYGEGWAGFRPDPTEGPPPVRPGILPDTAGLRSDPAGSDRDWIAGETVLVHFVERDSAGVTTRAVKELIAETNARSYYAMAAERAGDRPSINYTRADRIVVTMKVTADANTVESVDATGNVDGVHLQPVLARADSIRADSTRADSTARVVPPPPPPPAPPARP